VVFVEKQTVVVFLQISEIHMSKIRSDSNETEASITMEETTSATALQ